MSKIATYMVHNVDLFTDPITGEVNESALAEDACNEFKIELDSEGSAPERIWFMADTIARRHEIKTGAREGRITPALGDYVNHIDSSFNHGRIK